jgi:outer membrane immunogenic protein
MNNRARLVSLTVALATSALSSVALPSMAAAADLAPAPRTYTKAPSMVSPATNWSGFYGGVNLGYGWGSGDMSLADVTPNAPPLSGFPATPQSVADRSNGVIGGGQIGYNWQMGSFVTGLEADIQGSGIQGTATRSPLITSSVPSPTSLTHGTFDQNLSWFGTVRGRAGVTVTPDLLLFGTGGLAYGKVSNSGDAAFTSTLNSDVIDYPAQISQTKTGWAAGAGAEWMFARNWSAKVEYLHIDLGTSSVTGAKKFDGMPQGNPSTIGYTWHNTYDIVRAGVNYHFN